MSVQKQVVPADSINAVKKVIKTLIMLSGLLVVIFGTIPFFIYLNVSRVSGGETSWLETEAEVVGTEIKTSVSSVLVIPKHKSGRKTVKKYGSRSKNQTQTRDVTSYSPEITYKYTVDGKDYTGRKFRTLGYSSERKIEIEKLISKYPAGSKIKVFYNPSAPGEAAVEKAPAPSKVILIFGTIIICLGLFIIFVISRLAAMGIDFVMATNPRFSNS